MAAGQGYPESPERAGRTKGENGQLGEAAAWGQIWAVSPITRGRWGPAQGGNRPGAFSGKTRRPPGPAARACVTRAGRRPYSAASAGGAKMTLAQIAEAQLMASEWKPRYAPVGERLWMRFRPL
jgi:hypothetical protein